MADILTNLEGHMKVYDFVDGAECFVDVSPSNSIARNFEPQSVFSKHFEMVPEEMAVTWKRAIISIEHACTGQRRPTECDLLQQSSFLTYRLFRANLDEELRTKVIRISIGLMRPNDMEVCIRC